MKEQYCFFKWYFIEVRDRMGIFTVVIINALVIVAIRYYVVSQQKVKNVLRLEEQEYLIRDLKKKQQELTDLLQEVEEGVSTASSTLENRETLWLERCEELIDHAYVNNPVLAALLAAKERVCAEKEISFFCEMQQVPSDRMEDADMVRLFGNLLDNAIEAAFYSQEKSISMTASSQAGVWSLKLENSKPDSWHPDATGFKTTKTDAARHGYGTKIIKKLVQKYGGLLRTEEQGTHYVVRISL